MAKKHMNMLSNQENANQDNKLAKTKKSKNSKAYRM